MKIKSLILLLVIAASVFGGAELIKFNARSQSDNVVLQWQALSETNLKNYVVERKTVNGSFIELATVAPRQDKNYEYVDLTAFKGEDVLYVYRLKIVDNDGSVSHSWEASLTHNVSSVKRTWGSIKALFR
ncbi:MAG: hypothetical protein HYS25_14875 [Ignavibacteriales bacterium]|nr:hypothetical protein [Ignavibacteriales bacterium]